MKTQILFFQMKVKENLKVSFSLNKTATNIMQTNFEKKALYMWEQKPERDKGHKNSFKIIEIILLVNS